VNSPAPYEVTIAAKLQQLPVPDMMDSIWASIEMQLDADSSPGDNDQSAPKNPAGGFPGIGRVFYWCALAAVIIVVVLIYKSDKNDKNKNNETPVPAKTEMIDPVANNKKNNTIPIEKNESKKATVFYKKNSNDTFTPANRISLDSAGQQVLPFSKPDSSAILKNKPGVPSFDSAPPLPLIKPRGVKGITSDDYRIQESKKDSGKKGN
jgi:hypothetical protein